MNKVLLIFAFAAVLIGFYLYKEFGGNISWLSNVERREPVTDLQDYQPGSLTKQ